MDTFLANVLFSLVIYIPGQVFGIESHQCEFGKFWNSLLGICRPCDDWCKPVTRDVCPQICRAYFNYTSGITESSTQTPKLDTVAIVLLATIPVLMIVLTIYCVRCYMNKKGLNHIPTYLTRIFPRKSAEHLRQIAQSTREHAARRGHGRPMRHTSFHHEDVPSTTRDTNLSHVPADDGTLPLLQPEAPNHDAHNDGNVHSRVCNDATKRNDNAKHVKDYPVVSDGVNNESSTAQARYQADPHCVTVDQAVGPMSQTKPNVNDTGPGAQQKMNVDTDTPHTEEGQLFNATQVIGIAIREEEQSAIRVLPLKGQNLSYGYP